VKSFKDYIKEDNDSEDKWILVDALNLINNDCQQFLHKAASAGKFHALIRGLDPVWPHYEVQFRKVKQDRITDTDIRDSMDRVFNDLYGNDFREDSMIAGKVIEGEKHLIFPIGKFDYVWGKKVKDLTKCLDAGEDKGDLYHDLHESETNSARDKVVKAFLKDNDFVNNECFKECVYCKS
jgi:hypothetical protein